MTYLMGACVILRRAATASRHQAGVTHGSVGGAVRMNAGGHGAEIRETIVAARVHRLTTNERSDLGVADLAFSYRHSAVGPDDVESWVVANAIMGVHRALVEYVRARVLAGKDGPGLARSVRARAQRALDALDRGLRGYPDG